MTVPTLSEMKAMDDHEIETDEVSADEIVEMTKHETCNGFAFDYLESHKDNDVVVRDAMIEAGAVAHCFVVDHTRGVTIDATIRQFTAGPFVGVWEGDNHPYVETTEEVREWTSREDFEDRYAGETNTDFIC